MVPEDYEDEGVFPFLNCDSYMSEQRPDEALADTNYGQSVVAEEYDD